MGMVRLFLAFRSACQKIMNRGEGADMDSDSSELLRRDHLLPSQKLNIYQGGEDLEVILDSVMGFPNRPAQLHHFRSRGWGHFTAFGLRKDFDDRVVQDFRYYSAHGRSPPTRLSLPL